VLVRQYISTGEPVGSFAIAQRSALNVSSATVRHVLARLEEDGYVSQPHTSAGRVPTDRGYRFYVDQLLESRRGERTATRVEARLRKQTGTPALMDDVLTHVSHVLSHVSRHMGFAIAPPNERAVFQEIDFVPLGGAKVLVVLVARNGQLSKKVIDVGESLSSDELRQAANYLNREFVGRPLAAVREAVVEQIQQERMVYDALFARAMRLGHWSLEELPPDTALFVDGTASLLDDALHETGNVPLSTLSALLTMIEEKQRLVRILNEYINGPGPHLITPHTHGEGPGLHPTTPHTHGGGADLHPTCLTVVIGTEHSTPDLRPFSLVVSTYGDGSRRGTVGIIGPTRMRYSRAIAAVDSVALAVSRVLNEGN
jgi:heat-inducible transcriptional repressor